MRENHSRLVFEGNIGGGGVGSPNYKAIIGEDCHGYSLEPHSELQNNLIIRKKYNYNHM